MTALRRVARRASLAALALAAAPGRRRRRQRVQRDPEAASPVDGPVGGRARARARSTSSLGCPSGKGIVAGTDGARRARPTSAPASTASSAARSPSAGRRTPSVLFRAVSARHRRRRLQAVHRLHSRAVVRPQHDRDRGLAARARRSTYVDRIIRVTPGLRAGRHALLPRSGRRSSTAGTRRRSRPSEPPSAGLAAAIRVHTQVGGARVLMRVSASEALPRGCRSRGTGRREVR